MNSISFLCLSLTQLARAILTLDLEQRSIRVHAVGTPMSFDARLTRKLDAFHVDHGCKEVSAAYTRRFTSTGTGGTFPRSYVGGYRLA